MEPESSYIFIQICREVEFILGGLDTTEVHSDFQEPGLLNSKWHTLEPSELEF